MVLKLSAASLLYVGKVTRSLWQTGQNLSACGKRLIICTTLHVNFTCKTTLDPATDLTGDSLDIIYPAKSPEYPYPQVFRQFSIFLRIHFMEIPQNNIKDVLVHSIETLDKSVLNQT